MSARLGRFLVALAATSLLMAGTAVLAAEPGFDEPAKDPANDPEPAAPGSAIGATSAPNRLGDVCRDPSVLPELQPSESLNPSFSPSFSARSITLLGNTVLSDDVVQASVQPYIDRTLSPESLQLLRQQLTQLYIAKGYLNSGVVIPDQTIENGEIVLRAIEGQLSAITLVTRDVSLDGFVRSEIQREVRGPLSLSALETGIRRLELDPLIKRVSGRLMPGQSAGEATLQLDIEKNQAFRLIAAYDNHETPSVGANRGSLTLEHLNVSGHRDVIRASVAATEGLSNASVWYRLPFANDTLGLTAHFALGESEIIEAPFDDLEIEADNRSGGIALDYKPVNRLNRRLTLNSAVHYSSSETQLLDQSFSFARGAQNGKSTSTSLSVGFEWVERWGYQLLAVRSSVRQGVDWFNATTISGNRPDREFVSGARIPESKFTLLLSQVQWARRLEYRNSEVVVSATWQEALDPLLSVDKFAVGGHSSVRGFRENSLLRDNGVYSSIEWRLPLFRTGRWSRLNLMATPFFDYSQAWDQGSRLTTSSASTLSSIGLAFSAQPVAGAYIDLSYGKRLREDNLIDGQKDTLQDNGVHLSLRYQWSPAR